VPFVPGRFSLEIVSFWLRKCDFCRQQLWESVVLTVYLQSASLLVLIGPHTPVIANTTTASVSISNAKT
jgi:hypothetical protein